MIYFIIQKIKRKAIVVLRDTTATKTAQKLTFKVKIKKKVAEGKWMNVTTYKKRHNNLLLEQVGQPLSLVVKAPTRIQEIPGSSLVRGGEGLFVICSKRETQISILTKKKCMINDSKIGLTDFSSRQRIFLGFSIGFAFCEIT